MSIYANKESEDHQLGRTEIPEKKAKTAGFTSPNSVNQLKLQALANNSANVHQLRHIQAKANNFVAKKEINPPVQRKIKVNPVSPKLDNNAPVVQRGIFTTYEKKGANTDDLAIAFLIAKDLEGLVEQAASVVDSDAGTTNSSLALYRDSGTRAKAAKRGTAIHAETYEIIGSQLKGYGKVETKHGKGRADIILTLPSGSIIVYDITSAAQAEKAHTADRGYEKVPNVIAVIEISYDDF